MTQDTLQQAKERFSDAQDAFREQRRRMVEDLEFSNPADPKQWNDSARRIRENGPDGARPCLTLDHTNQYIAQTVNDCRQNKPAIHFLPVSGGARQEVAAALEGIARHIEYQSRAQIAYDTAVEHAARIGLGWIRLVPEVVDPALNYQEIRIKRVHDPLSVLCDPDWTEPDGSDIQHGFVQTLMTKKAFARKYPKAKEATWSSDDTVKGWIAGESMRVCEYFDRQESKVNNLVIRLPDGTKRVIGEDAYWQTAKELGYQPMLEAQYEGTDYRVIWRTMSGVEIIEETDFPSCHVPLVPVVGYELWIEGKRYLAGMVRRMMEAQRAYNYERSAWVEAVALQPKAPYLAAAEAIEGHESDWGRANKANLAYLTYNAFNGDGTALPAPQRMAPPTIPAAFAQGAQFADNDIQASVGMYRANLGAPSNEKSGRAIMARQKEGDTANFHYSDNESRSIERVGRIMLDMITRLYDEPRESRILGMDGMTKPVRIDPKGSAYAVDGDVATINPSTGTYDLRVQAGPSYTTLRQEASEGLQQMMQGNPAIAAVVGPIWARMQDWPESDKLSKALLTMAPPPVQQIMDEQGAEDAVKLKQQLAQMQQEQQQLIEMMQAASQKIEELQREVDDKQGDMLLKAGELEIREFDAQTKRIQVLTPATPPEQLAQMAAQLVMQAMQREPLQAGEEIENTIQQANGLPDNDPYGQAVIPPPTEPPEVEEPNEAPQGAFSLGE